MIEIDTDKTRLDVDVIHGFLRQSYWAEGIPRDVVERSIEHSLCFGVYVDGAQVGFARIISDYATFAYLADVFVLEAFRGQGLSKRLIAAVVGHPRLQGLRRWSLATRDAHALYAQFGFAPIANPARYMERIDPAVYSRRP
jgi:GNAT superfamily N-acetyltransferase